MLFFCCVWHHHTSLQVGSLWPSRGKRLRRRSEFFPSRRPRKVLVSAWVCVGVLLYVGVLFLLFAFVPSCTRTQYNRCNCPERSRSPAARWQRYTTCACESRVCSCMRVYMYRQIRAVFKSGIVLTSHGGPQEVPWSPEVFYVIRHELSRKSMWKTMGCREIPRGSPRHPTCPKRTLREPMGIPW